MGDEVVHQFNTFIAGSLGLVSVVVFLYLIDYAARLLRPVSIVQRVGKFGMEVIQNVYPETNFLSSSCRVIRYFRIPGQSRSKHGDIGNHACRGH